MPITPSKASSARKRRWNAPPPLTRGTETLEGEEILEEVTGPAGVLLWQSLRNVSLWTATEKRDREHLFSAGAADGRREAIAASGVADAVREPLETVADLLESAASTRSRAVAGAAVRIAEWALSRDHVGTALVWMQAAALATPRNADLAYRVGMISRTRREFARAESWFRQAITTGRQTGTWSSYVLAYVELSEIQVRRGSLAEARRSLVKAMRAARRKGLAEEEARSLHSLQRVSALLGRHGDAESYARLVFDAYGADHRELSRLTRDVAHGRVLAGSFGNALPLLRALEARGEDGSEGLLIQGHIARAAAGLKQSEEFEAAAENVRDSAGKTPHLPGAPAALLDVAHGASLLGKWTLARKTAVRAAELGREQVDLRVAREAEALERAAREKRPLDTHPAPDDREKPFEDRLLETLGGSPGTATAGLA